MQVGTGGRPSALEIAALTLPRGGLRFSLERVAAGAECFGVEEGERRQNETRNGSAICDFCEKQLSAAISSFLTLLEATMRPKTTCFMLLFSLYRDT